MDAQCLIAIITLTGANIGIVAMFLDYKVKFEKKSIILEKQANQQKSRINELEKKNGAEQKQITEWKKEVELLKNNNYNNEQRTENK